MLIIDDNTYRFRCDSCGRETAKYATLAVLMESTHFGNTLWDEDPGWVYGRGPEQVTGDDAINSIPLYPWLRGPVVQGFHLCPSCRGLFNRYYA